MDNKIKVGIIGGAGYTGGELIRILLNHPNVSIVFIQSNSNADKPCMLCIKICWVKQIFFYKRN